MIRIVLLGFIILLLAGCAASPGGQPAITSSAPAATVLSSPTIPTSAPLPGPISTPTSLPSSPPPSPSPKSTPALLFDQSIDNLAVSPNGLLYASGFQMGSDLRHFAQWSADGWSELGNGFSTAGNSLASDEVGNIYTEILTNTVD